MAQVKLQRQRRHQQKRQRRQQRQPVGGLHRFDFEHALERGQNEGARHQPGDIRIEHDQQAPLQLHLVRIHETVHARYHRFAPLSHRAVQVLVVDLGFGGHVRLQHLHLVVAQEFVHGVLGVLEIHKLPRPVGQFSQQAVVRPWVMRW